MILHSKAQLQLGAKCTKRDSIFYHAILIIKRSDIVMKRFYFKIMKNDDNVNFIVVIELKEVRGNRTETRLAS